MNNNFERILSLVRRTGDKIVVFEKETDSSYVVMDFDEYELMVDVQDDLCAIVGHDPYDSTDFDESPDEDFEESEEVGGEVNVWDVMQDAGKVGETWDPASLSGNELAELEDQYQAFANRHVQDAIDETQTKKVAPEPVNKTENDDDFGEESFYLEPVE